jgi:carnitine 3-dehydrogenase
MKIACIGTGLIGSGWALHFLRTGHEVVAYDVDADRERALRKRLEADWGTVVELGTVPGAGPDRLTFMLSLEETVAGAALVQESAGEDLSVKQGLLAELDALAPDDAIIASSSSGFLLADMVTQCRRRPGRVIVAHPFNPPYLVPLVEIVTADPDGPVAARARDLFAALGSMPIVLRNEIRGYAGNRLQSAVLREVLYLLDQEVLALTDVDAIMRYGPGLRWPVIGPVQTAYLGAAADQALEEYVDLLVREIREGYSAPADFVVSEALVARFVEGIEGMYGGSREEAAKRRDESIVALRRALDRVAKDPGRR